MCKHHPAIAITIQLLDSYLLRLFVSDKEPFLISRMLFFQDVDLNKDCSASPTCRLLTTLRMTLTAEVCTENQSSEKHIAQN